MVIPSVGAVVTILFPFSDLSKAKLRPAIVLADADNDDWILAQITSKPYADAKAINLKRKDFSEGSLKLDSYIRPGKLSTANRTIFHGSEGTVSQAKLIETISEVVKLFNNAKLRN